MRNRLASAAIKSTFLHNVLLHKDKVVVKNEPLEKPSPSLNSFPGFKPSNFEKQDRSHFSEYNQHSDSSSNVELNSRMEFFDQTFRTQNSKYLPLNIDYSPPSSPGMFISFRNEKKNQNIGY